MPFRRKPALQKFAALNEATNWIAYDNFEGVLPESIDPEGFGFQSEVQAYKDRARHELQMALKEGELIARGRFQRNC